jgi:hypothetical protein
VGVKVTRVFIDIGYEEVFYLNSGLKDEQKNLPISKSRKGS